MAKAGKATSTDWIWLRDARNRAADALGSKAGAEEQLLEWMATGKLPWTCTRWKAPDAADIARMNQILVVTPTPQTVYCNGDSRFMADGPDIDWEDNSACEASYLPDGARAQGIKVSRAHLQTLLPDINLASAADGDGASAKAWITAEVKRMKIAGEIPPVSKSQSLQVSLNGRCTRPFARAP